MVARVALRFASLQILTALFLLANEPVQAQECEALSETTINRIFAYLRQSLKLPDRADFRLLQNDVLTSLCYRTITISSPSMSAPIVLYVSPDQKYLSASLIDLEHPSDWKRIAANRIHRLLSNEPSPTRGTSHASVTVVVFSDFQCSYCKRFNDWIISLPQPLNSQVRVVFKHLPSPSHDWSSAAARIAICAALQSQEAFWVVHDFFFAKQERITSERLEEMVAAHMQTAGIDSTAVLACSVDPKTESVLSRDSALAANLGVRATPIFFVNGMRAKPVQTQIELETALRAAVEQQ